MNYQDEAKQIVLVLRAVEAADRLHLDANIGWLERAQKYKLVAWGGYTDSSSGYMLTPIGRLMLAVAGADLRGADLDGADLSGANLSWLCGRYEFTTRVVPYTDENAREYSSALPGWEAAWANLDDSGIFVVYRRSSDAVLRLALSDEAATATAKALLNKVAK
jgi:hypothetical protein